MNSKHLSPLTEVKKGIIVDLGTGDGRFVYQSARQNPHRFYIGIDASANLLEKLSEKIHRKPTRGGLKNALFLQAAVEALPEELNDTANEVHVHFPWGSLLRGVATGDATILKNIRRICAPNAVLEVIIGVDKLRDASELARLGIDPLSKQFVEAYLISRYAECGFNIIEFGEFEPGNWPDICSSWANRLRTNDKRTMLYIIAESSGN